MITDKIKPILLKMPEYAFVVLALLAAYSPPFQFNPIFLAVAVILVLQIIFKNRLSGIIIGGLILIGSLFFLGALISEFSAFTEVNRSAVYLLLGGIPLWGLSMMLASTMVYKYSIHQNRVASPLSHS